MDFVDHRIIFSNTNFAINNTLWTGWCRMAKEINQLTGRGRGCYRCSSSWRGHDIDINTETMTWHRGILGVLGGRRPPSLGVSGVTLLMMGVLCSITIMIAQRWWGRYMFCVVVISTVFILSRPPWGGRPHLRGVMMRVRGHIHVQFGLNHEIIIIVIIIATRWWWGTGCKIVV